MPHNAREFAFFACDYGYNQDLFFVTLLFGSIFLGGFALFVYLHLENADKTTASSGNYQPGNTSYEGELLKQSAELLYYDLHLTLIKTQLQAQEEIVRILSADYEELCKYNSQLSEGGDLSGKMMEVKEELDESKAELERLKVSVKRTEQYYLKITELVYLLCIKLKIPEDKQSLILSGKLSGKALINLLHPPEGVK